MANRRQHHRRPVGVSAPADRGGAGPTPPVEAIHTRCDNDKVSQVGPAAAPPQAARVSPKAAVATSIFRWFFMDGSSWFGNGSYFQPEKLPRRKVKGVGTE